MAMLDGGAAPLTPFAPPFLRDGDLVVSHVANILDYLGPKLGLAPKDEKLRRFAHGLQLTITDFVAEAHDTHHPISTDLYYEDQKAAAKKRSAAFLAHRVPKYLGYFEQALSDNPAGPTQIVGDTLTTADLSLFQIWAGTTYAFPRAFADAAKRYPKLAALVERVAERPNIARYLASSRRIPFNTSGVFPPLSGTRPASEEDVTVSVGRKDVVGRNVSWAARPAFSHCSKPCGAVAHPVTAATLARELEVSERTIYRDLSALAAQGAPIQGQSGVGYVLRPGLFLPPLMLTEDETEAVLLGLRLCRSARRRGVDKGRRECPRQGHGRAVAGDASGCECAAVDPGTRWQKVPRKRRVPGSPALDDSDTNAARHHICRRGRTSHRASRVADPARLHGQGARADRLVRIARGLPVLSHRPDSIGRTARPLSPRGGRIWCAIFRPSWRDSAMLLTGTDRGTD